MPFGVSYHVVGRADCPYFARAERLAQMLKQSLQLPARAITIETVHPSDWAEFYSQLCRRLGFGAFQAHQRDVVKAPDHCLVFHPHTKRLVGGEKAFRKEVAAKYDLTCDVSWGLLQSIARENLLAHAPLVAAVKARQLGQPLAIVLAGQPGCGKSTLAKALAAKYHLARVSTGEILRSFLLGTAEPDLIAALPAGETKESVTSAIRSSMLSGELVPDTLVLPLILARIQRLASTAPVNILLDGFPRTEQQALQWRDWEEDGTVPKVGAFLRFADMDPSLLRERLAGRRIDPLTQDIYHTTLHLPSSAIVLSRLTRKIEDEVIQEMAGPQMRVYAQTLTHILPLFKSVLHTLASGGTSDEVRLRAEEIVGVKVREVEARKTEAEAAKKEAALLAGQHAAQLAAQPNHAVPAAASARSSPISSPAPSPHTASSSPLVQPSPSPSPVTPLPEQLADEIGMKLATPLTSSRRVSLVRPSTPGQQQAGIGEEAGKTHSRRGSGLIVVETKSVKAAREAAEAAAAAASSKPASRRGSVKFAAEPQVLSKETAPLAGSGSGSSGPLVRRVSLNRRSSRASGSGAIVAPGMLKSEPAPARVVAVAESSSNNSRPSSTGLVAGSSRPTSAAAARPPSRPSSGKAPVLSSAAVAAATSAVGPASTPAQPVAQAISRPTSALKRAASSASSGAASPVPSPEKLPSKPATPERRASKPPTPARVASPSAAAEEAIPLARTRSVQKSETPPPALSANTFMDPAEEEEAAQQQQQQPPAAKEEEVVLHKATKRASSKRASGVAAASAVMASAIAAATASPALAAAASHSAPSAAPLTPLEVAAGMEAASTSEAEMAVVDEARRPSIVDAAGLRPTSAHARPSEMAPKVVAEQLAPESAERQEDQPLTDDEATEPAAEPQQEEQEEEEAEEAAAAEDAEQEPSQMEEDDEAAAGAEDSQQRDEADEAEPEAEAEADEAAEDELAGEPEDEEEEEEERELADEEAEAPADEADEAEEAEPAAADEDQGEEEEEAE